MCQCAQCHIECAYRAYVCYDTLRNVYYILRNACVTLCDILRDAVCDVIIYCVTLCICVPQAGTAQAICARREYRARYI